ncbi:KfrB domain-containing protein [Methylobacter psychrophilus]|uniref:KfrB domain-containing protein n=1 Tax=Methylobacter psychrophilus TaxID=96941 RepID=UPI0021D4C924|nr:KfrB domain-containing protein [Methylobacter psychrophilus]
MKQRMIVMNGQRIVESEQAEEKWQIAKVDKAHGIKPGIYNLYKSSQAVKTTEYAGVILHTDKRTIYQQVGKNIVKHESLDFNKVPEVGQVKGISYNLQGKAAMVEATTVKLSKGSAS